MRNSHLLALPFLIVPCMAGAEAPMSAIDWLSRSISAPVAPVAPPVQDAPPAPAPVPPADQPLLDRAGLLTPRQTGLPRDIWAAGEAREIAEKITAMPSNSLPALHQLSMNLLLTEAEAPRDAGADGLVFFARLDKLLAMGALDQAQALLDVSAATGERAFRRRFDIALLQGTEDAACKVLDDAPQLAPTYPARIFCLARTGDWPAAAVTLHGAQALGLVLPEEDALIARFLDPDLFEGEPPLPPPSRPTPLQWRMFEAVGEPLPTNTLPLAFAHAELRSSSGWKAQLDAAERLSRAAILDPNQLLGLYTLQRPAASGGVWDRVQAVQALDAAIAASDPRAVAEALPIAYSRMEVAELEVPLARIYAPQLSALPLTGEAARLAGRMALLAGIYDSRLPADATPTDRFLAALAAGQPQRAATVDGRSRAIAAAFDTTPLPTEAEDLLSRKRRGEAVLFAMDRISRGVQGDLRGVTDGLSTLRALGLEADARRVGLQLMILERRG